MNIYLESDTPEEDKAYIIGRLDRFGEGFGVPIREHVELNIILRDDSGAIQGAMLGYTYWNWLHIEFLWVDEEVRGGGYGFQLLEKAEKEAKSRGCVGVHLDTHDFQAPDFYIKNGYHVVGTIKDLPEGHERYDMVKMLHHREEG